jgi:hypothetical protein
MMKMSLKDTASDKLAEFIDDNAGADSNFKMINTRLKNKDFDKKGQRGSQTFIPDRL